MLALGFTFQNSHIYIVIYGQIKLQAVREAQLREQDAKKFAEDALLLSGQAKSKI